MPKYFNEKNVAAMLEATQWLKINTGLTTYPVGGTLLGIVREKDFIEDDYDIDIAYLSLEHTLPNVIAEFDRVHAVLKKHNLLIKRCAGGQLHIGPWSDTIFDLWTAWIDTNGRYHEVPSQHGELTKDEVFPLKPVNFLGHTVNIMSGYARALSFGYGTWEVKDPNFKPDKRRIKFLSR